MDPRIQKFLAWRLSEDTREIQVLDELRNDVEKLENYLRMYMMQEVKGEKVSAEKYTPKNQACQDEKVDWTRMTQQWQHISESATGRSCEESTQMYTPMNQASQSKEVDWNRITQAAKQTLESKETDEKVSTEKYTQEKQASQDEKVDWTRMTDQWQDTSEPATGRGRGWSTQMYTPMNQATQSENVGGNRMSQAAKHILESSNTIIHPGGSRSRYVEDEMRPNSREGMSSLYNSQDSPSPPPIHNTSEEDLWSSNSVYAQQWEYRQVHAQMQSPMVQYVLNTGVDRNHVKNVIERRLRETGNTYPNAEALMNAVLNYEQKRTELNASSPHHQEPSQSPQTASSQNPRRHPRSSNSSHQEETRQAHDYMQSSMVQSVLDTDVDRDRVRNVIEKRLKDRGNTYPNAEALMTAALNCEQNRTSSTHHQRPSQIPQAASRRTSNPRRRSRSSSSNHQEKTCQVHDYMQSSMVQSVLNTGVDRERVRSVIEKRLRDTGNAFPNAEALMNAVMNSGQNREVLNTLSSGDQDSPVIPQNAPQSHLSSTEDNGSSSQNPDLEQEVRDLRQKTKCKVCLESEVGVVFLPCGHLCCCNSCAPRVKTCPVCRSPIKKRVRTYII